MHMGDEMIEIFKSGNGKKIISMDDNSGISILSDYRPILLTGSDEAISQLRIALNSEWDGWDQAAIEACKFSKRAKLPPLSVDQKTEILRLHAEGQSPRDIAVALGLILNQVNGVVQGHLHPVRVNMAKQAKAIETSGVDKIIMNGRKHARSYLSIANEINREVGGNWLPNDVANRIKEMKG